MKDLIFKGELCTCENCGKTVVRDFAIERDGRFYCTTDCLPPPVEMVECSECHEMHPKDECKLVNGEYVCNDCLESLKESGYVIECYECGELCWSINTTYVGSVDAYVCDDCLDGNYVLCAYCDEWELKRDAVWIEDIHGYYCNDCLGNGRAWQCADCGNWYSEHADQYCTEHDDYVCYGCLEDDYTYCEECSTYVENDHYNYDADMCNDCAAETPDAYIRDYHCNPPIEFYGDDTDWFIGTETEIDMHYDDHTSENERELVEKLAELCPNNEIYFERDGSLNVGFEIITQPHTLKSYYKMPWQEIFDACISHGYKSHDIGTCGLHMHISRVFFGKDKKTQDNAIAKLLQFYELYYDDCLKVARRTPEQAGSWANNYGIPDRDYLKGIAENNRGSHGIAVNCYNRDTIELRLTRGTLNYETHMACIDFMVTICKNAKRIGWNSTTDAKRWLKGIKYSTWKYLKDRYAFNYCIDQVQYVNDPQ